MSGHSAWKNIRDRKGAQDKKRNKLWTKALKELVVAVKTGGSGDPDFNARLRLSIQNCRAANMPRDIIERAIKKALGGDSENYSEVNYECFGPDGIAIFIECATNNVTRTVSNIRSYFSKYGGNLGKEGCLQFVFARKGVFSINAEGINVDDFTMNMIDAGAEDVEADDGIITVTCEVSNFGAIQKALSDMSITPKEAGLQRVPLLYKKIDPENFETFTKLVDVIEDDDDVQKVYHNLEFDESLAAKWS